MTLEEVGSIVIRGPYYIYIGASSVEVEYNNNYYSLCVIYRYSYLSRAYLPTSNNPVCSLKVLGEDEPHNESAIISSVGVCIISNNLSAWYCYAKFILLSRCFSCLVLVCFMITFDALKLSWCRWLVVVGRPISIGRLSSHLRFWGLLKSRKFCWFKNFWALRVVFSWSEWIMWTT